VSPKVQPSEPIADWLVKAGIELGGHDLLVEGLAARLTAAGIPIERMMVGADALHPTLGGRSIRWVRGRGLETSRFTREQSMDSQSTEWLQSPLYPLITQRLGELRRRLALDYREGEFPLLDRLKREGLTDYVAFAVEYPPPATLGEVEGMVATFATAAPGGFDAGHLAAIRRLVQPLALAYKAILLLETARTVTATYLGADAAARVLAGRIARGEAETIRAVIWYSDLEGFTRLADSLPNERLMALLNDYAGLVLDTVAAHEGQVLKLIGDGALAIFDLDAADTACRRALDAAVAVERAAAALAEQRSARGEPSTRIFIGLHLGEVLYGNVGSAERLDFTVLGPAVNEASRIERMCRSLEQPVVVSASFAAAAGPDRDRLVSLGRYALRGVARPQELFTLDRERPAPTPPARG
jgi:adenylate cyclase